MFNSFKRPETISEGEFELNYTYGPEQERIKSVLKQNGSNFRTRIYASNFEINEIIGGPKHEICYISSTNGLCAMYVNDVNAGVGQLHYTYTDNLGSILAVTNEAGTIEARQNFDAWGRRRNAQNYTYLTQNTSEIHNGLPGLNSNGVLPPWLYRGYTGHEMLDEFTLINMNARLYDPIVGLMLSCDNYVQDATNTQNYNRYAYCYNNPLKYTDPSGNYAIADDIAAAAIGGTLNVIGNWKNIDNFGQGAAYFGIGALGGWVGLYTAGAGGGAVTAIGNGLMQGQTTGKEIFKNAAIGGAAGLAGYGITSGLGSFNYGYDKIGNDLLRYGYKATVSAGVGFVSGMGGSAAGQTMGFVVNAKTPGLKYNFTDMLQAGINGALTGAAISIGYSAYDFATWDRFSQPQKADILSKKYGAKVWYCKESDYYAAREQALSEGADINDWGPYDNLYGFATHDKVFMCDKGLSSNSIARITYWHEMGHNLADMGHPEAFYFERRQYNESTPARYIDSRSNRTPDYSNRLFNIFR